MGKRNNSTFFKEFFKEKSMIGSIIPSSPALRKKMLENIDFSKSSVIVEFGPGTGVFTRQLHKKINKDSLLLVFELHKPFYERLKQEFSEYDNIKIINDSAEKVREYLAHYEKEGADIIISSLPLANFKKDLTTNILEAANNSLKEKGYYIQFQYSLKSKKLLQQVFSLVSIKYVAINIPPAFVYLCQKK